MRWDTNRKRTPRVEFRQGYGARGAGDGSGQQPLFKLFVDNPDFRRWLTDTTFRLAY